MVLKIRTQNGRTFREIDEYRDAQQYAYLLSAGVSYGPGVEWTMKIPPLTEYPNPSYRLNTPFDADFAEGTVTTDSMEINFRPRPASEDYNWLLTQRATIDSEEYSYQWITPPETGQDYIVDHSNWMSAVNQNISFDKIPNSRVTTSYLAWAGDSYAYPLSYYSVENELDQRRVTTFPQVFDKYYYRVSQRDDFYPLYDRYVLLANLGTELPDHLTMPKEFDITVESTDYENWKGTVGSNNANRVVSEFDIVVTDFGQVRRSVIWRVHTDASERTITPKMYTYPTELLEAVPALEYTKYFRSLTLYGHDAEASYQENLNRIFNKKGNPEGQYFEYMLLENMLYGMEKELFDPIALPY